MGSWFRLTMTFFLSVFQYWMFYQNSTWLPIIEVVWPRPLFLTFFSFLNFWYSYRCFGTIYFYICKWATIILMKFFAFLWLVFNLMTCYYCKIIFKLNSITSSRPTNFNSLKWHNKGLSSFWWPLDLNIYCLFSIS